VTISADTNVFVYAVDGRDPAKQAIAQSIISALARVEGVVGLQVIGELQNALRRRLKLPAFHAIQTARNVLVQFSAFAYDQTAVEIALAQSAAGKMSYWDALLLTAADAVGVTSLISEDMTDGLVYGGLEIINPFAPDGPSARVRQILAL